MTASINPYLLRQGTQLAIAHQGKDIQLFEGMPVTVELKPVLEAKDESITLNIPSDPAVNPNKPDER
ncbi:hypothetical protein [Allocoleopsis franciscana]|uniref:Uncharacterized protein n=1 Tax=Allocoleopsis franciscana PCC 7113 TaxID=1173027 RepID=K9W9U2_9CYAN|nr:hypothetical protein [Allocoleopsis franciscana]AFZ17135.1 hypothetical protein Mic7113_1245 [Allocoleopsis franciscana PCC 7113]